MDDLKKHGIQRRLSKEDFQCVVEDHGVCDWFDFRTDVKQGSNMSVIFVLDRHEPGKGGGEGTT